MSKSVLQAWNRVVGVAHNDKFHYSEPTPGENRVKSSRAPAQVQRVVDAVRILEHLSENFVG